jgi:hypothetical protein
MDTKKLMPSEIIGCVAGVILVLSLLFLPWYDLSENPERDAGNGFICGVDEYSCTGFETFPILRWLLIAAAAAPLILAWIVVRGHKLSWPPGEMTMVVGFTAFVLIAYNGLIDPPGSQIEEIGVTEAIGYYIALIASAGIAGAGVARAMAAQKGNLRKTPGTV